MCGINGIFEFSGLKSSHDSIDKMNHKLKHRGPDANGTYVDSHIQLGHQRLAIIDLDEKSNQPFFSNDKRYVLVFNGEIYNYNQIREKIEDYSFQTKSDTEVLLAAYIKWGKNCVSHFKGMFAFAIWDSLKKEIFIVRDRLGIKPLYYYLDNDKIIFSSSIKSILASELIPKKLNQNSLIDYLRFQTVHAPETLIDGVKMLETGSYIYIDEEKTEQKKYWDLTQNYQVHNKENYEDVKSHTRKLLTESVEKRMVSDVPFGSFLSGGIDSSIIVALMSQNHNQKINTFSIVFKEDEFSEKIYAKKIADLYQTDHHEIELSQNEFKESIQTALQFMDHPSGDGLNTYIVSKKTKEAGITMALSGLGGDELFGGYSVFNQIPDLQEKKWLASFPNYARKYIGIFNHLLKNNIPSSKIKEILKQEYFDLEYVYQFYRQVLMDDQVVKLININQLPLNKSFEIAHENVGFKKSGWNLPSLSRISVAEIKTYMQNVLLRDTDQMSMASALEVRVPFLDHELVEYVLGIKDEFKKPTSPKKLLVETFQDLIPEEIYNRPKMGFVLPYEKWMKEDLKDFCIENLNELKKLPLFKENGLDNLWNSFLKDNKRVTWSRIWHLVVLGNWLKENNING